MSNGKGKGRARRVQGLRRTRTAEDRARDRAVNRAIASAGEHSGPIIVRVGERSRSKSSARSHDVRRTAGDDKAGEGVRPSALVDALAVAGVKFGQNAPAKVEQPAKLATQVAGRKPPKLKEVKKPRPKPVPKHRKASKPAKSAPEIEAEKLTKRQRRFDAEMQKLAAKAYGKPMPSGPLWKQKQKEIDDLIENIERATFATLAGEWKKHVGLTAFIERAGRKTERLPKYTSLIAAIEREWGRRANLAFNSDEYFDWPSTRAGRSRKGVGDIDWAAEGFLSYLGYHVGESSDLTDHARRAILRRTFRMVLPPLESPEYVRSWGQPSSSPRLKKMADSLASFARSAKRRSSSNFATAIAEWEGDLAMLRDEFYVAKFGFGWPQV